jgi:peptide subunit release factor 1 (eRF1)
MFKTEASRLRQCLGADHQAHEELERNLEDIRATLAAPETRQARGMAVFCSARRGLRLALPADVPYEDRIVVDEEPYVVPLLEAQCRERGYLVVLVDTHRGRWYAAAGAGTQELGEIAEAVPKKQHSAGERWGKKQATIARHREDHILHAHKELAQLVTQSWRAYNYQGIILFGQHEILKQFRNLLSPLLAARVVHESPCSWSEEPCRITDTVREVLNAALEAEQRRLLDEIDARIREGYAVATGPQEVLDALRDGQATDVVLGPDRGERAERCTGCRSVFVAAHRTCPYCRAPCELTNLWQAILAPAVRHDIAFHFVGSDARLATRGGVAALLARDSPPW